MQFPFRLSRLALFIGVILSVYGPAARAQSLSAREVGSRYMIEASAPANNPATLQVSDNLRLWVDVREHVQEPYSFAVDAAGESERYYRLVPMVEPAPPINVMVLGDSLAADCCGWGQGLPFYFKENGNVINYGEAWMSSKTFLQSTAMERMLLVEPEYVFINFAWADGSADLSRQSSPEEFASNMRTIVQTIRGFNGVPILVTIHANRVWDNQGNVDPWEHQYNYLIRAIAAQENAPLVDLYKITREMFTKLGPASSPIFLWSAGDTMHVSERGAQYFSRLLLRAAPQSLAPYLTGIFDPPPPAQQP